VLLDRPLFPEGAIRRMLQAHGSHGRRLMAALLPASVSVLLAACSMATGMRMQPVQSGYVQQGSVALKVTEIDPATLRQQASLASTRNNRLGRELTSRESVYTIGPADVLQITVWDHPELAMAQGAPPQPSSHAADAPQGTVVDQSGYIQFPYAGKLKVDPVRDPGPARGRSRTVLP
jgi:polysaccharide export outer membrane protein